MTSLAKPTRPHSIRFGSNLYHHVDRIYDFYPHWIESRWTEEAVERDLKILRSLGSGLVRYHIHPVNFEIDRYPGAELADYRRLVPYCLAAAKKLGMRTHIDLHTDDFENIRVEDVLDRLRELGPENIDTLQVINEYFFLWKDPKNLDKIESIFLALEATGFHGNLCIDAGGSIHRQIRKSHPRLARFMTKILPMHHYTYAMEWDDLGIDTFIDLLNGKKTVDLERLTPEEADYYSGMVSEQFGGLAEEIRVMEINAAGFHYWTGGEIPARGSRWPEIARRLARETNVTWLAHWCFRTKTSWREFGGSHTGLLYACDLPRPEAGIFRDTALELMPKEDIYSAFRLDLEDLGDDRVRATLTNRTNRACTGVLTAGDDGRSARVTLQPNATLRKTFSIPADSKKAINHCFAEFTPSAKDASREGACLAWVPRVRRQKPALEGKIPFPISEVRYAEGLKSVESFLAANADRLAIVVERSGGMGLELAVRLQDAMAEAWGIVPSVHSTLHRGQEALSKKACVILGSPEENSLARLIQRMVPADCLPLGAETVISAHPHLWKRPPHGLYDVDAHWVRSADVATSPGILLVWANSLESLRSGAYDLIQRIRPPTPSAEKYVGKHDREAWAGTVLDKPRRFAVRLPAGRYRVSVTAGTRFDQRAYATRCKILGTELEKTLATANGIQRLQGIVNHKGGLFVVSFAPAAGKSACPAAISITHPDTAARVFKAYFHNKIRVAMDYDNYAPVSDKLMIDQIEKRGNWMEIRSEENESVASSQDFGWVA